MPEKRVQGGGPDASQAAVRYHDSIADGWDARYREGSFLRRARFFETQVLPCVAVGGRWLDAGCGSGYFSRLLAARGGKVMGVDASMPMIGAARRHAAQTASLKAPQFEAVSSVERLPFAAATFDGCICLSVIEYVDNPRDCLHELARVLVPGGVLVLSLPHRFAPLRLAQRLAYAAMKPLVPASWAFSVLSRNAVTRKELARTLAEYGLELRKTFNFDPAIPAPLLRLFPAALNFAIAVKCKQPGDEEPIVQVFEQCKR